MRLEAETIAAFDFDGTITKKDTLFDFILFYHGRIKLLTGLLILSPVLFLYIIGILKNSVAKQVMFSYFFKNESISCFDGVCQNYSARISKICNTDTLERLLWHQQQGHKVVIVSASIDRWIMPWAEKMKIDMVIATTIKIKEEIVEGYFLSKNCYGIEKVNRFIEKFPNRDCYTLFAYGDSKGDKELLEFSDYPTLLKNS